MQFHSIIQGKCPSVWNNRESSVQLINNYSNRYNTPYLTCRPFRYLYSHWIILGGSSGIGKNILVCWSEKIHDILGQDGWILTKLGLWTKPFQDWTATPRNYNNNSPIWVPQSPMKRGGRTFWTFDRGLVKLEGPAQNYGPCGGAESTAETQSLRSTKLVSCLYYSSEQNDCAWSEKAAILSASLSACNLPYLLANKDLQQWALQTDRAESEDMGTVCRETISIANVALRWTPQGKREAFPTPTGEGLHRQNFRP